MRVPIKEDETMTTLSVFNESQTITFIDSTEDFLEITRALNKVGVLFERWQANKILPDTAEQDEVLNAYTDSINKLKSAYDISSIDVVSLKPDNPNKKEFRNKFLAEHTHDDFEIRFFVDGCGLFYLHINDKVYCILCEKGDLISVPANTPHWFDMGENPDFKCIRLFTTEEGWVANFTGTTIAEQFPNMDEFLATTA